MSATSAPGHRSRLLGLPVITLIALALLTAPRVVLHDLGLITEGTGLNALLVAVPPVVWIVVTLVCRVPNPFLTILTIGAFAGVILALTHQLLWNVAFEGSPPQLGGNLAGLAPGIQDIILRTFASVSSLFTGVIMGAVCGLIAWGVHALVHRPGTQP